MSFFLQIGILYILSSTRNHLLTKSEESEYKSVWDILSDTFSIIKWSQSLRYYWWVLGDFLSLLIPLSTPLKTVSSLGIHTLSECLRGNNNKSVAVSWYTYRHHFLSAIQVIMVCLQSLADHSLLLLYFILLNHMFVSL